MTVTLEDLDRTVDAINVLLEEIFKLRPELREVYLRGYNQEEENDNE